MLPIYKHYHSGEQTMTDAARIVLFAVTRRGLDQARRLRTRLRSGEVLRPDHYGPPAHPWEQCFTGPLADQVVARFTSCDQLIFFLAAGAVTRLVAPCLASKTTDPGVLAIDEMGQFVVPLLSGHKGGANAFARTVAACLGATAVITTASDASGTLSPDMLQEAFGWIAEPRERMRAAALALVNNQPVAIIQEIGVRGSWLDERELPANVSCVRDVRELAGSFAKVLWITDRVVDDLHGVAQEDVLWYRPHSLVLGAGCERGIALAALEDGLTRFLDEQRLSPRAIGTLATVDLKADEPALVGLCTKNGWHMTCYTANELAQVKDLPSPSAVVERCIGTPGVAEPAALLASGSGRLLATKQVLCSPHSAQRMTFALARLAQFEAGECGKVIFIGAGPGDPELLTVKARNVLASADVVVYAGSLIPEGIVRLAPANAVLHDSAPLTLAEVMSVLIAAARAGRRVVRLQSGDTSLYSAIGEQMALLDEAGIAYEVIPGISSYQALAAALCAELTVPETVQTVILTRAEGQTPMPAGEDLEALARHGATLAIFLSARLSDSVQQKLLCAYPADTPVVIAYRVSWPDEKLISTTLAHLHNEIRRHRFTRTTLILVGSALKRNVAGDLQSRRSQLYDPAHGHIFRARRDEE
jgi:precorrin-4 C11-methyltransferase